MLEKQANKVFLGIGSNLGNKKLNIENAKLHLELNKNFRIFKTSKFYKTKSWPNPKMPNFLNIVIEGKTILKPYWHMRDIGGFQPVNHLLIQH